MLRLFLLFGFATLLLVLQLQQLLKECVFPREHARSCLDGADLEAHGGWIRAKDEDIPRFSELGEGELEALQKRVKTRRYKKTLKSKKGRIQVASQKNLKKTIGKPKGGKGGGRKRPTRIDREESVVLESCPTCGESFAGKKPHSFYDRSVTDMVFLDHGLLVEHTKYRLYGYACERCQKVQFPRLAAVPKGGRFGYGMITFLLIQRIQLQLAYDKIVAMVQLFFHDVISKTTLIDWMKNSIRPLEKLYKHLWKHALKSGYLHVDETGLPLNGEHWWMWVFVTKRIVVYHAHKSRGHDAIQDEIAAFQGVIISDFWSAYNKFDQEQQKCWAHLIRDLEEVIYEKLSEKEQVVHKIHRDEEGKQAFAQAQSGSPGKRGRKKQFPAPLPPSEVKHLKQRIAHLEEVMWQLLTLLSFFTALLHRYNEWQKPTAAKTSPLPLPTLEEAATHLDLIIALVEKKGVHDPDLERILKRLKKFKPVLFTFLKYEEVPPTNNPAERAIRPFVTQRKGSGSFKSEEVTHAFTMHLSLKETCKLNHINYPRALHSCLCGKWEEVLVQLPLG